MRSASFATRGSDPGKSFGAAKSFSFSNRKTRSKKALLPQAPIGVARSPSFVARSPTGKGKAKAIIAQDLSPAGASSSLGISELSLDEASTEITMKMKRRRPQVVHAVPA